MTQRSAPRSLRRLMLVATIVVAVLAAISAAALIGSTTLLQRTTERTAASVESVRLVEEAEINLLLYARTVDPVLRHNLEGELRRLLEEASEHVTSVEEARVLSEAEHHLGEYRVAWATPDDKPRLASAEAATFAALERLVDLNLAQARVEEANARALSRFADVVGISLAAALVLTASGFVWWLRGRVLRPVLDLADTMRRFGGGDRAARAPEDGPLELREMSERFNAMATAIATQREQQVAFLGGIAHDLRTPLSAVRLAVDMLAEDSPDPRVAMISRQIDRLERMTGDFLDMSKIEAGRLELHLVKQDLRPIGRSVVDLFSDGRHRIELDAPEPVVLACDEGRINQAITNLVSNAVKYSPPEEPVHVAIRREGAEAVIEVVDHGAGIAREDHERIFEPFQRTGAKDSVPGSGLGLFNVKRLVEAHGGTIEVESALARGSTFRIHLPLEASSRAPAR